MNEHGLFPDLILWNGNIRTQDMDRPRAGAVAVGRGRFLAVGGDEEIRSLAGPDTRVVDLCGRLCLPGLMDAHFHFYDWAVRRLQLTLADAKSFQDFLNRVSAAVRDTEPGRWILGQGWNEADWPEHRMPAREDLDRAAPSNPVALWRCDLHLAVANSAALELAGINETTSGLPEGSIEKDASGRPTGILREGAPNLIKEIIPSLKEDEIYAAMREGIHVLHSLGLTALEDIRLMGGAAGKAAFTNLQLLRNGNDLDLRCWVSIPGERLDEAVSLGLRTGFGDDYLRIGHVKYFADGGMGARTAWMLEPYLDAGYGMPATPMKELERSLRRADKAGLAVVIHSIGDRTNRELVTVFKALQETRTDNRTGGASRSLVPHRIDHVQMIRPEDLARLARLDVVACVQPHNLILDIAMIDECVGEKGKWTYPYRDMLDHGIRTIFSSDTPVCDPSPLAGIHAAVTRQRKDGTPVGGWYPSQRISVEEAVRGYTIVPAMCYGVDDRMGSIAPGKYADMVVLSEDIYTIDPMKISETTVDVTVFDGRIVFERQ
jgi:predicted amidohydrolase YtcJ